MNNCKFLSFLFIFIFTLNFAKGQETESRAGIIKAYPLSVIKDEFRLGLEKELKKGKSIEFGGSYLYKSFEPNSCKECYYLIPGYFTPYTGNGATIRFNWQTYSDSTKNLSGFYTSVGLRYKFFHFDKPDPVPSGPKLPYGYYYANQNALYVQGIFGKQFVKNNFVANIYGGISIFGKLNYFQPWGYPYATDNLKRNPQAHIGSQLNLGISFGYLYN